METLKKITLVIYLTLASSLAIGQTNATTQAAFSKSYEAELDGNYSNAISILKPIYSKDHYVINIRLGWLHYLAKQYTESSKYYNIAIALKPYAIEARFGCVKPLSATENWEAVKKQYLQIIKIDPQNTVANYWLGVIYFNQKNYGTAANLFGKNINLYPLDYDSVIMLAWTKLYLGKFSDAKILFNQALVIRPLDKSALEGLKQIK